MSINFSSPSTTLFASWSGFKFVFILSLSLFNESDVISTSKIPVLGSRLTKANPLLALYVCFERIVLPMKRNLKKLGI